MTDTHKDCIAFPGRYLLPSMSTCCLPRVLAASNEYLLPPMRTYYLPALLRFRELLEENTLKHLTVGCFTTADSLSGLRSLYQHSNQIKQQSKIYGGELRTRAGATSRAPRS